MKAISLALTCAIMLIFIISAYPAGAALMEVTVKGTVSEVSTANNTITLSDPLQYGCDYGSGTSVPVCSWTSMNMTTISGTVPDQAALSIFAPGDQAVAVSLGGSGGTWIALAKLYGSGPNAGNATDEIGDISSLQVPLVGAYSVTGVTLPNCSACYGTRCTAVSSKVTISSEGSIVSQDTLKTGEFVVFSGRNDGSSIEVDFFSGEASSASCPAYAPMTGPQPVSDYEIHAIPPIGIAGTPANSSQQVPAAGLSTPVTTRSAVPWLPVSLLGTGIAFMLAKRR